MRAIDELKEAIRARLPVLFGRVSADEDLEFVKRFDDLVSYGSAVSAPVLSTDTLRYQSILLKSTLLFLSISFFEVNSVKIFDSVLSVDPTLLIVYAGFICAVIVVFVTKANMDYERTKFTREKNVRALGAASHAINIRILQKQIQFYFWLNINDLIGRTYKHYADAMAEALDREATFQYVSVQNMNLDLASLRTILELSSGIAQLDQFAAELEAELSHDTAVFAAEARRALDAKQNSQDDDGEWFSASSYSAIETSWNENLRNWFEARDQLGSEILNVVVEDNRDSGRAEAVKNVAVRIVEIRRLYAATEVVAPVLLALASMGYIIWQQVGS